MLRAQCRCCWSPIWTPYIMSCRISSADPKTGVTSCPRERSAATTGAVYSFGFTLFVGIVLNFVMGMLASRLMLKSLTRFKFLRKPWLLGGERG